MPDSIANVPILAGLQVHQAATRRVEENPSAPDGFGMAIQRSQDSMLGQNISVSDINATMVPDLGTDPLTVIESLIQPTPASSLPRMQPEIGDFKKQPSVGEKTADLGAKSNVTTLPPKSVPLTPIMDLDLDPPIEAKLTRVERGTSNTVGASIETRLKEPLGLMKASNSVDPRVQAAEGDGETTNASSGQPIKKLKIKYVEPTPETQKVNVRNPESELRGNSADPNKNDVVGLLRQASESSTRLNQQMQLIKNKPISKAEIKRSSGNPTNNLTLESDSVAATVGVQFETGRSYESDVKTSTDPQIVRDPNGSEKIAESMQSDVKMALSSSTTAVSNKEKIAGQKQESVQRGVFAQNLPNATASSTHQVVITKAARVSVPDDYHDSDQARSTDSDRPKSLDGVIQGRGVHPSEKVAQIEKGAALNQPPATQPILHIKTHVQPLKEGIVLAGQSNGKKADNVEITLLPPAVDGVKKSNIAGLELAITSSPGPFPTEGGPHAKQGITFAEETSQRLTHQSKNVANQLSESMRAASSGTIEIKLSPEELGRVKLSLAPVEAGLSITIQAERADTMDLIRRHVDLLAQDLRQQGHQNLSFHFGQNASHNRSQNPTVAKGFTDVAPTDELLDTHAPQATPLVLVAGRLDIRL